MIKDDGDIVRGLGFVVMNSAHLVRSLYSFSINRSTLVTLKSLCFSFCIFKYNVEKMIANTINAVMIRSDLYQFGAVATQ